MRAYLVQVERHFVEIAWVPAVASTTEEAYALVKRMDNETIKDLARSHHVIFQESDIWRVSDLPAVVVADD